MENNITMCGYCCDICHAYVKNINENDKRKELSKVWSKYYNLNIPEHKIYCDGCRSNKEDAIRLDNKCPVRKCVIQKCLNSCADCNQYPCSTFESRRGLSYCEAQKHPQFKEQDYIEFLRAFDNGTRIETLKKR